MNSNQPFLFLFVLLLFNNNNSSFPLKSVGIGGIRSWNMYYLGDFISNTMASAAVWEYQMEPWKSTPPDYSPRLYGLTLKASNTSYINTSTTPAK